MQFVLLAIALGLASGIAGLRLTLGVHRRILAMQRLHDGQATAARRRIGELEEALADCEARLMRSQALEAAGRRTHPALLSAVSREMRGPLETVMGYADLLRINAVHEPLTHRQEQAAEQISHGAARLHTLIEGMTTFAGASGPASLTRERLDPLLIARRICQSRADQAAGSGVTLCPSPHQSGLTVRADAHALDQVLSALIDNAVRHSGPGDTVRIEGRRVADAVWITVRDMGPGLSAERMQTLFDPFARRDRAVSVTDGAGVGLAAARRLVTAMGGELVVESREGEGAAFTLRLPALTRVEPERTDIAALPLPRPPEAVLLYIADDPAAVALMRHLLHGLGQTRLHVASSGQDGAAMARDLRPDAIILDLDLQGGQGLAAMALLEAETSARDLPVMALSAAIEPGELTAARTAGFAEYLTKPVRLSDLAAGLSRLLALPSGPAAMQTQESAARA